MVADSIELTITLALIIAINHPAVELGGTNAQRFEDGERTRTRTIFIFIFIFIARWWRDQVERGAESRGAEPILRAIDLKEKLKPRARFSLSSFFIFIFVVVVVTPGAAGVETNTVCECPPHGAVSATYFGDNAKGRRHRDVVYFADEPCSLWKEKEI